jgi:hypothetical protein
MIRWIRRWRERDDRHLIKLQNPLPEVDPIEELARIIGDAQEQDAEDEGRFNNMAQSNRRTYRRRRPR